MAKTKCDKNSPFQYTNADGQQVDYQIGDKVVYYIGKKLGDSHGTILKINTANITVEDLAHYRKKQYIRRENVKGIYQNSSASIETNVLEFPIAQPEEENQIEQLEAAA